MQGEAAVGVAQGRGRRGYSTVSYPYPATFVNTIVGFKSVPMGGFKFVVPPGGMGTGSSALTLMVALATPAAAKAEIPTHHVRPVSVTVVSPRFPRARYWAMGHQS